MGDWEWDFYWVAQPNVTLYITAVEGLFIGEILAHFEEVTAGLSPLKLSHTFAHDGDMGPVLGALGIQSLRWPALGSSLAMELWQTSDPTENYYVRVLYSGAPLRTSTGDLSWVPYTQFKSTLEVFVPTDIVSLCNS
jgi:2-phosphoxylose phosphatase